MKKTKKILIVLLVLVLALVCAGGVGFAVLRGRVPEMKSDVEKRSTFYVTHMFVGAMAPNADEAAYDTQTLTGLERYWRVNHNVGRGMDAVLQVTKDGEVVVLAGDLPGQSNSQQLYGDKQVGDLTIEQLRKVNLLYNVEDEEGFMSYRTVSDRVLFYVSVLSLSEYLNSFNESYRSLGMHFLHFKDESAVPDLHAAIDKVNEAVKGCGLGINIALCLQSDDAAAYVDATYPDLQRAATPKECAALDRASLFGRDVPETPYVLIYADAFGKYANARFIRYAQNLGVAVAMVDTRSTETAPDADDVLALEAYGADFYVTYRPDAVIQILKDARQAAKESRLAEHSTEAP